jgi:hypothetical protein
MTRPIAVLAICAALFAAVLSGVLAGQQEASAGQVVLVDATPKTATNVINTDHTVTATVTLNSTPLSGATVIFNVTTGPNAGQSASPTTDVNGQATFIYTGAGGVGTDAISACIFTLPTPAPPAGVLLGVPLACDNVTKDWINPSPTPSATASASPTTAATVAGTVSPTPTFNAPAQLPITGAGSNGKSGFPWVIVAVSVLTAAAFLGGRLALRRVR